MKNNLIVFSFLESFLYSYILYFMSNEVDWFSWYRHSPDGWGIMIASIVFLFFAIMLMLAKAVIIKEGEMSRRPLLLSGIGICCIFLFLYYGDDFLLKSSFVTLILVVLLNCWVIWRCLKLKGERGEC